MRWQLRAIPFDRKYLRETQPVFNQSASRTMTESLNLVLDIRALNKKIHTQRYPHHQAVANKKSNRSPRPAAERDGLSVTVSPNQR